MDLSTVNAKLESGKYKDRFDFEADFRLMISNAKTYNAAGSYAHGEAVALEAFFDKRSLLSNSVTVLSYLQLSRMDSYQQDFGSCRQGSYTGGSVTGQTVCPSYTCCQDRAACCA